MTPARRRGPDLGGGHQLRAALRAARWWSGTGCWCARSSRPSRIPSAPGWAPGASSPPASTTSPCPTPTCPSARRPTTRSRRCTTPASRWPPCASASSSTCRRRKARRPRRPPRPRPRPAITQDNAFWFEGARAHTLLIQHCTSCGTLRHPPLPACGDCRSLEWDTVEVERPRHPLLLRGGALPPGARRSSTRCRSGWSSWRRGRGWWPTSRASSSMRLQVGMAAAGHLRGLRRRAVAARVRAGGACGAGGRAEGSGA